MKKAVITIISVLLILAVLSVVAFHTIKKFLVSLEYKMYPLPEEYLDEIEKWADEYDVPIEIVCGIIHTESGFDPEAVSRAGAKGMMQITKDTFEWILFRLKDQKSEEVLFDYKINIQYGTYLLSYLYSEFGDWDTVFAAYNAGIGSVKLWLADESISENGKLKNIPYKETADYVEKVNKAAEKYKQLYFSEQISE